jgi:O-antigen/teichoic acid export membrane protein
MKKEVLIYFSGKIIPALVNLAMIVLAIRFLGEEEYGKYSLVFYATMLVSTLTFGWIQQSILRFLSSFTNELTLVINRFFYLALLSSLTAAIVVFFLARFYFHLQWFEMLIVLFYAFMYNLFMFHLTVNMARLKPWKYAILESSYNLLYLVLFIGIVYIFHQKVFIIIFAAMGVSLILTEGIRMLFIPGGRYDVNLTKVEWDSRFSKKVFDFGFTITLWLFLSYILNISDRFIIKEFGSYKDVGIYSAVKDLMTKIATFTTMPIILAYHPKIMETWNSHHRTEALRLIREALSFLILVFVVVFIALMISKDFLYQHLLKLDAGGLWIVTITLILNGFLWQAALMIHKPLELLFRQRSMVYALVFSLVLNIGANLVFVPRYGYASSAVIAFVSALAYASTALFLSSRMLKKCLPDEQ